MTWKSYTALSGAGLLATYLVSAPPTVTPGGAPAVRSAAATGAAPMPDDIEEQAARLASRVRNEVAFQPPARNPFRFGARTPVRSAPPSPGPSASAVEPEPAPVLPPPPPPIRLNGIATSMSGGTPQRVAVLLTPDGVVEARAGDMAGAYRVVRVDDDAVEVVGPDGVGRRLTLRP